VLPHEPGVRAWLARRRSLPLEIDDLIQEAYAVLAALESVDHIHNPRAYFLQVVNSLILREFRRAKVVSILAVENLEEMAEADAPSPEQETSDREQLQQLADALRRLPSKSGEAFRLRKVEGLSQRAVAERMGISESTVEKHIAKALGLLMVALGRGGKYHPRASRLTEPQIRPALNPSHDASRDQ
jgi:RNA polymerase sigma-70 factor (ECF subfamily)